MLDWAVVVLPTILSLFVSWFSMRRGEGFAGRKWWALGFVASGILISVLVWWQQERSRHRATQNQEQLRDQISTLLLPEIRSGQHDFRALREDLRVGLQDIKDEIMATRIEQRATTAIPFEDLPPPAVSEVEFIERRTDSSEREAPYGLQVIIRVSKTVQPTSLRIECTDNIADAKFFVAGQMVMMNLRTRTAGTVFEISFDYPPLRPESPLVVTFFSKTDIRVKSIDRL